MKTSLDRPLQWLAVLFWLTVATVGPLPAQTNSVPPVPLAEIIARWKPLALPEVAAAAEQGEVTAMHYLGYYHTAGIGGVTNAAEGIKWYHRAAEKGFPNSINNLGVSYLHGLGVAPDRDKALGHFRRAMDMGFAMALRNWTTAMLSGPNLAQHWAEVRALLEGRARRGEAEAQVLLGQILMRPPPGSFVEVENAIAQFKLAAAQGRTEVIPMIGGAYMMGGRNYAEAAVWHERGAGLGLADSQTALGWLHFNGLGVPQDAAKAFQLTERAAAQNHTPAMVNLGRFYALDLVSNPPPDSRPDYAKAAGWYEKASRAGNVQGSYLLAHLIVDQKLPGRTRDEARPLFEAAAKTGHREAQEMVAELDLERTQDPTAGLALLHQQAEAGIRTAMVHLGRRYQQGQGVPADPWRAMRWFYLARTRDLPEAWAALDVLDDQGRPEPHLGPAELRFAQALSRVQQAMMSKQPDHFREVAQTYLVPGAGPEAQIEAAVWLGMAGENGDAASKAKSAELAATLPPEAQAKVKAGIKDLRWRQELLNSPH